MSGQYSNEPMLDMFIFETAQLIEQLEQSILAGEQSSCFSQSAVNDIFRIMHTIKGSSAMMVYENISTLAHSMEDLFYFLREEKPRHVNCPELSDLVLEGVDFIKAEMEKIKNGDKADGDSSALIKNIKGFLYGLKQGMTSEPATVKEPVTHEKQQFCIGNEQLKTGMAQKVYKAVIYFNDGCEMENIRAFSIIHKLKELACEVYFLPEDIIDNDESAKVIRQDGFRVYLKTEYSYETIFDFFMQTVFLKDLELTRLEDEDEFVRLAEGMRIGSGHFMDLPVSGRQLKEEKEQESNHIQPVSAQQNIISVNVTKLDKLMDLVGEMVIAEAMVTQNPDVKGLELDNFRKAARQLHKITAELQDLVMSIRMVPLTATFHKMQRIVRDMSRKLGKEIQLNLAGEETEVDKNIIEHLSDPLMHLIRNSIDHGIGSPEERVAKGKQKAGIVTLEAKNAGGDVFIIVRDDGKGLDRNKILRRAKENGLLNKPENEMSDKEIFNLIFLPGFSTKDSISEYSGRGVGMDVVTKNIEAVGGSVSVDSTEDAGTTVTIKIPLTLAIIDGMNIKVGNSCYIIPTISIKESFRPDESRMIRDPDGNEMIMVRGQCYPILRLHEHYCIKTHVTDLTKGILVMVEAEEKYLCIFADALLGQQHVVVKALPEYIRFTGKIKGLAGCTLLGDGNISLILDIAELMA